MADKNLKSSGITYTIDGNGIQYPQKITTVNSSLYPLLDSHFLDWNESYLKYISKFDKTLINAFSYGVSPNDQYQIAEIRNSDKDDLNYKTRYEDECQNDNEKLKNMPLWHTNSYINNSAELLDIIDFLSWQCSYSFNLIKNLYDIENTITPILSFKESQISKYGGTINNEGNVDEDGMMSIKIISNQCDENFEELITNDGFIFFKDITNERTLNLYVLPKNKFNEPIVDNFYFTTNDGHINLLYDIQYIDANTKSNPFDIITISSETSTSTGLDLTSQVFIVSLTTKGWKPTEILDLSNRIIGYDDCKRIKLTMYSDVSTDISSSKSYLRSNNLSAVIEVQKAPNIFTHIYIAGIRYIYLEKGFFNESTYEDIKNNSDRYIDRAFLISTKILTTEQQNNLTYQIFDNNTDLLKYLISVESDNFEDDLLYIANNKTIEIEIYPKYFGKSLDENNEEYDSASGKKPIYNGEYDYHYLENNVDIIPDCDIWNVSSRDDKITITGNNGFDENGKIKPEFCEKNIDGINRKGFKYYLTIENKNFTNDISNRTVQIYIRTSPGLFIGGTQLCLPIKTKNVTNIVFKDMIENGYIIEKSNIYPTDTNPFENLNNLSSSVKLSLKESTVKTVKTSTIGLPDHYEWDINLPIYNDRSWGYNTESSSNLSQISPNSLYESSNISGGVLSVPSVDTEILLGYKASTQDYTANIKKVLSENIWPNLLCGIYSYDEKNGKYTNVSIDVDIDYVNTYRENKEFLEECSTFIKSFTDNMTEEYKGKLLVSKYCGIIEESSKIIERVNVSFKKLVFYRPTVPDDRINEDYENNWTLRNNKFKLVLYINDNTTGGKDDSMYERQSCIMNVIVTRADNKYAGWTSRKKKDQEGACVKILKYEDDINVNTLVSNKGFSEANNHVIQTRLSTNFIPIFDENNENIISVSDANNVINIKYKFNDKNNTITFHTNSTNEYEYKVDDIIENGSLEGNINSDTYYRGIYNNSARINFKLVRKNNTSVKLLENNNDNNIDGMNLITSSSTISSDGVITGVRCYWRMENVTNNYIDLENYIDINGSDIYNHNTNVMQLSVTGAFWNENKPILNYIFRDMVFESAAKYDSLNNFIIGKYNTSPEIERPTTSYFNKWYDMYDVSKEPEDLDKYITIENSKITFTDYFNSIKNNYDEVWFKIIGVLPMTSEYRGYVIELKLKVKIN